jgi:hypothetical protein
MQPQQSQKYAHLRLAAEDGDRLAVDRVPATDIAETVLHVSFEGITEEEQRAALAAFPGGKRFVLVPPPAAVRRAG